MKHKIITRQDQNNPDNIQYQLRWYVFHGLLWDIIEVPNSHDPDVMRYPPYIETTSEWVDDKGMIFKFIKLKKEYDANKVEVKKPNWKIVAKEEVDYDNL